MKPLLLLLAALAPVTSWSAAPSPNWRVSDTNLVQYFETKTRTLAEGCLAEVRSAGDWAVRAPEYRRQLAEMLGLDPLPARTDLQATVTKRFEADTFTVENLHFQSRPGLYVTANLYVPKNLTKPAPTVLYVCGHSPLITNGVSYGTKVGYQHWGSWFARNGYVCLIIDTLESGEILGEHHGTYRAGLWWWNSRGYTPAGVECWNGMRALDYLGTRPEVDTNRYAVTGRSGGGAYSWYLTAMDDRIKAAAPTAGITDLENHVVDGAVEGHCDCMFLVNTYRWDYPQLAALAAPRPLLLCNTDADNIFPLDGVVRLHGKVRRLYGLLGAEANLGLVITPGPHQDTQELQVPVMRWFNRHLKGEQPPVENAASKLFSPQQLKVFETLPADSLNARIHETFVPVAEAKRPETKEGWGRQREEWLVALRSKVFGAWPANLDSAEKIQGQPTTTYGLVLSPERSVLSIATTSPDESEVLVLEPLVSTPGNHKVQPRPRELRGQLLFSPLPGDARKQVQIRRRHLLLGETVDSARVLDLVRAVRAIRASERFGKLPIRIEAAGDMAVNALYAALFAPVDELVLTQLPPTQQQGPDYLNVRRVLDLPQVVALAAERGRVELRGAKDADWEYAQQTARQLGWENRLRLVP